MDFAIIINCKIIFYFIIYVNKIFFNEKYFFTVEKWDFFKEFLGILVE